MARAGSTRRIPAAKSDPPETDRTAPERLIRILMFVVIGVLVAIRIGLRDVPMERDEGVYVYMGGLVLQGAVPYVDVLEMKPPGLFYTYAALHALSAGDPAAMRVLMALLWAAGAALLFRLARRWIDPGPALVVLVAYGALSLSAHASGFTVQADHWVAFFTIAGISALVRGTRSPSPRWMCLAGALLCWSVLIKQNAIFFAALAPLLVAILRQSSQAGAWKRTAFRDLSLLALGAAIPAGCIVIVMAFQGNFKECWFWTVECARLYASQVSWSDAPVLLRYTLAELFREQPVIWALGALGIVLLFTRPMRGWKRWVLLAWLIASVLSVMPGKRFIGHYFLHFFPAFALCAGVATGVIGTWIARVISRPGPRWSVAAPALALLIIVMIAERRYYFAPDHTALLRRVYHANPFPEARAMADLINARYREGDGLFVLGSEPQIHVYTRTRSPSRFVYLTFLMQNHPLEQAWRTELMEDLRRHPPKYVVWVQHRASWMPAAGADQAWLEHYWNELHRDYEVIAWCEQTRSSPLNVVTGAVARDHVPETQEYMFLAQRRDR